MLGSRLSSVDCCAAVGGFDNPVTFFAQVARLNWFAKSALFPQPGSAGVSVWLFTVTSSIPEFGNKYRLCFPISPNE